MDNLIVVNRVVNNKDKDRVIFKSEDGKIIYLDRKDKGNDIISSKINMGDSLLVAVTTSNTYYDFAMGTCNGMLLNEFIDNIPYITADVLEETYDRTHEGGAEFRLLINVVNNNSDVYNTEITLPNLIEIYDNYDISKNLQHALVALQYLYNTSFENSSNNGIDASLGSKLHTQAKSNKPKVEVVSHITEQEQEAFVVTEVEDTSVVHNDSGLEDKISELKSTIATLETLNMYDEADAVRDKIKILLQDKVTNEILESLVSGKTYYVEDTKGIGTITMCTDRSLLRINKNKINIGDKYNLTNAVNIYELNLVYTKK